MEYWGWNFALFCFIIISPALFLLHHRWKSSRSNLRRPPGPRGWPVFGNIFSLGTLPHISITALDQQYGPVIRLKLGSRETIVIRKADAAANFFKNHDASFADRTITEAFLSHDFYKSSILIRPYDAHQRLLKRLCNVEMLSSYRINEAAHVREKCVNDLLAWVAEEEGRVVEVGRLVFLEAFNLMGNLLLSRDLVDPKSKVGSEFFLALMGLNESMGRKNIADAFPWLRRFDVQGIKKKLDGEMGKILEIASGFVKQRIVEREGEKESSVSRRKDVLDVLLDYEPSKKNEPEKLSELDIVVFVLEMFNAGSETTSSTVEWALAEILRQPKVMVKVKAELTTVVGPNKKLEDKHIDNLPYLQAVVKETLRLHPPGPFLLPRRAIEDVNFLGYHIPKNTQVLVNVWAIARDPESWDDPLTFNPDRFLGSKVDYKGQNFQYLPFGSGRRMCPGIPIAQRTGPLILGSLLHEFDWKLESHVTPETIDMKEKTTMSLRKSESLKAIPKKVWCDTN